MMERVLFDTNYTFDVKVCSTSIRERFLSEWNDILFSHGEPFNEPVVVQGPFVMNSREEIAQAYEDFQYRKMGTWE